MQSFTLTKNRWYAWMMIPGYVGQRNIPYCSPIYLQEITPLKSGKGILRVAFWNTGYAEGVQNFEARLGVLHRNADYLVARILYENPSECDRCAVISHIEFGWIERFCSHLWHSHPPHQYGSGAKGSVSLYLDTIFNVNS